MFRSGSFARRRVLFTVGITLLALGALSWVGSTRASNPRETPRFRVAAAASAAPSPGAPTTPQIEAAQTPGAEDARIALGRKMFFDPKLSVPEGTSCATCHDPAHGYAGNATGANGVAHGSAPGRFARRSTPSALYLRFVPRFHLQWEEEAELPEAFGGFFWDGRASTVASVAPQPLLNPNEMGNRNAHELAAKLRASVYASELSAEFDHVFDSPENTIGALGFCLEAFLISPDMAPFSSKYDDYLRGTAQLSPLEAKGLALFDDRSQAACSSCHKFDRTSRLPEASLFTDYGYDTVAVPRNRLLPQNRDPRQFDLGVCERRDSKLHTEDAWYCGAFRTPSLRNVAVRSSFMHNGVFSKLRDVVSFYATRASEPKRWYPSGSLDDLPEKYQKYVNTNVAPYNRAIGEPPVLAEAEIDAIVAFLGTLTDRDYPRAP